MANPNETKGSLYKINFRFGRAIADYEYLYKRGTARVFISLLVISIVVLFSFLQR